ncbi:MAG: hypothetical protein QM734_01620 [Cyclobacteriaceae bacterium]
MKKVLFGFLVAVLASCEKSQVPIKICYLSSELASSTYYAYLYNDKNQVASYTGSGIISSVLTYDSLNRIISEFDNGLLTITYNYDNKSRLTLWTQEMQYDVSHNMKVKFFYNSANQDTLIQYYKYSLSTGGYYMSRFIRLSFSSSNNKNYSRRKTYNATTDTLLYTEDYLWDTHPNPHLSNPFFTNEPPPTNNVTQYTFTPPGGAPQLTTFEYTYNNNGYPLTQYIPGFIQTVKYEYANCN